jgi:ABC-type transporter Mla subunit MlaD
MASKASAGFSPSAMEEPDGTKRSSTTAEDVSQRASDVAESAKQVASEAGERLNITMEDQKRAGAQRLSQFAQAVVTAADQLDQDSPEFARYIRGAAKQVEGFSEKLRTQNVSELFHEFQAFAKSHPTAFLGATVLTGFALARFLKSSADTPHSGQIGQSSATSHRATPPRQT